MQVDIDAEAERLRAVMDKPTAIFSCLLALVLNLSCGDGSAREDVPRDAFGHIKLDKINPGAWFAKQFADKIGADKFWCISQLFLAPARANDQDRH